MSIFVECPCKNIIELPTDESDVIKITGRPKCIASGNCSKCGHKIVIYTTIWYH